MTSTCIQGKMEVGLEMFHCDKHTCLLSEVLPSHRNISCDFVAKQMYGFIMDNLNYEPKMIIRHIEQTYQYTMQSVSIWLCVLVVPFHLWELLSSSCMGA